MNGSKCRPPAETPEKGEYRGDEDPIPDPGTGQADGDLPVEVGPRPDLVQGREVRDRGRPDLGHRVRLRVRDCEAGRTGGLCGHPPTDCGRAGRLPDLRGDDPV